MIKLLHPMPYGHRILLCAKGIFITLLFFLNAAGSLFGATITWSGATNNNWNTGSNWTGGFVPAAGDIANIPGSLTNYPIINNTVTILTVNINTAGTGATLTVTTGGSFTVSGLTTVNGNGSFIHNGGTSNLAGLTSNNIVTFSGGTLLLTVNLILNNGAAMTQSGGLIHMAVNTGTAPTDNLLIATGGTLTQSDGTLYIKDWLTGGGTFNQTGVNALFKIFHDWKPGTGSVFNSTAGTVQFSGSGGGGPNFAAGTRQFTNIIIDAGVDPGFSNTVGSTFNISGNFTNNSTILNNTANSTFTFNGTTPQTITSASTGTNSTFSNLTINSLSTVSLVSNIIVAGNFSILEGTFDQASYTMTRATTGGVISMASGTYLTAGAGIPSNFTTNTFSPGSTVIFTGNVSETIPAYNYFNLTSTGTGARVLASTGTIGIAGVFTPGTNAYTITGSTINFNGTGDQTIPAFNYNNLTTSGARTIYYITYSNSGIIGVAGIFNPAATFTTGGRIITGSTIEFNGTGSQTIPAFTYNNLTTSGARTTNSITYASSGTIAIAGTFSPNATFTTGGRIITGSTIEFNGTGTQTIPAFTYNNLTSSNTGSRTLASSGTVGIAGNFTPGTNSYTVTGSTVDFNGSGAQTIGGITFNNLTTSNAGTKSSAGNIIVNGTFTVTSPTIFSPGAADVISGTGTLTGTGTIQVTRVTGTPDLNNQYTISNKTISTLGVDYIGAGAQTVNTLNYGNLTISTNGTRTVTLASSGTIGISGTFSPTATTTTYVVTGSTINFNGSGAQTIPAFTFNNLTTSIGGTKTTGGSIVVNGIFTITSPTIFNPGATHIISGSGTLTGTGEIDVTRITAVNDFATQYSIANKTLTNLIVEYSGLGNQIINNNLGNYFTLKTNGSGTKTLQGNITVTGDIIIIAGTLDVTGSNYSISIGGNFTNNATVSNFTERAGTVTFTGNNSVIDGTTATRVFYNIIVDKTAGQTLSTGGSVTALTVNDFTQTSGNFTAPTTFTINGNVLLSAGTFTTGAVTVAGNWTNNGGSVTGTSVIFSGLTKTISGTVSTTFPDITITTGTITLNTSASCTGFTLANNNVVNSFTLNSGITLTVNGSTVINQASGGGVAHTVNVNDGTLTVNGNLTMSVITNNAGRVAKLNITTGTINITGDLIVNNTIFAANGVIDMSGGGGNLYIAGNFTVSTLGTLTPGTTSTVIFNGTGSQSIPYLSGINYNHIKIDKTSGTATLTANTTIGGDMILQNGTLSSSASNFNLVVNGNWTNNGGIYSGGTGNVTLAGATGNISGTTTFPNLIIDGLSTTAYTMLNNNSCSSLIFSTGNFASSLTHSGSAALIISGIVTLTQPGASVTNAWNINAGSATVSGLISFAGTNTTATRIAKIVITTGTLNAFGGLTFATSNNATKVIDMAGGKGYINMKGSLTVPANSGTLTPGTNSPVFNYVDSINAQTVNFFALGSYGSLWINNISPGGATLSAAITTTRVANNVRIQSGTLSNGGFAIALNTNTTFEVANGAIFKMTGTTGMVTGTTITKTFGATSTCDYNGAAQTVSAETYGHLTLSSSGTKTMPGTAMTVAGNFTTSGTISATAGNALTISGNVTLGSGTTLNAASFTHNVAGNWTNNGATFTAATSTINLNGSTTQTLGGTIATLLYNNLIINKPSGSVSLSIDLTVNAVLTFTKGVIATNSYKVIQPSGASVSGAGQSTGWVNGNLQKYFSTTAGGSFQIGGTLYYSPATISFATVTTAGSLIAGVTATSHPNVSTSDIADRNIPRYWTLSTPGSGALVYSNATIAFNWNTADNFSPLTTTLLIVAQYNASSWSYPTVTGTTTTSSIQINGISTLGAFAIGQRPCLNLTWTGAINNQWNDGGNWSCGEAPNSNRNVNIPGSLSTYPVISGGIIASANNITIQSGGALTISSSILKIAGTLSNNGTLTATTGTIEFNGTSSQTIPAAAFATNTIKDLTINNTTGVTLGGTLNITGDVTISNGSLTTGGNLILKSSATATARIATITSIHATPVNGNVTVERYIPGRRKYRIITSSVTTSASTTLTAGQESLSIWGNWQTSGTNAAGLGNIITGGTSADGFDQNTTNASMFTYNPSTRRFVNYTSANGKNTKLTPLKAGIPYYMFVYGDRLNTVYTNTPSFTVIKATGTILTGDQTYNTSSTLPISNVTGEYAMIGNPYASPIDWATLTKTNLANTYWGWDPNLSSTGGFITVTTTGTVTLISPFSGTTGLNQYIQPGQGFFVRTTAASPVLVIKESDKVSNFNANAFRTSTNSIPLIAINLWYDEDGSKFLADGTLAAFDSTFNKEVGKEDAVKILNATETVAIENGVDLLSIDARKLPQQNDTLLLNIAKLTKPQYTLQIFASQMENKSVQAFLEDKYLKTVQPLLMNDTNRIVFKITSDVASGDVHRFKILFTQGALPASSAITINAVKKDRQVLVNWKLSNENEIQKYEVERSADASSFFKMSEINANGNIDHNYLWLDVSPNDGNNYYRIKIYKNDGSTSYSKTVLVIMDAVKSEMNIFPNPIANNTINIYLKDLAQGDYAAVLYNQQGQQVFTKTVNHNGGTDKKTLLITNVLTAGIYHLELKNNSTTLKQMIIIK